MMTEIIGKKMDMPEMWGRGFDKIKEACAKYDGHLPEYNISSSGIMVLCKACDKYLELLNDKEDLHLGQSDQDHAQVVKEEATKTGDAANWKKSGRNRLCRHFAFFSYNILLTDILSG